MLLRRLLVITTLSLVSCNDISPVVPAPIDARLNAELLQGVDTAIERSIKQREIAGAVMLITQDDAIVHYKSYGDATVSPKKPMQKDSIFRIASMTKAITTAGVMLLHERGLLELSDPLSNYLPEFSNPTVVVEASKSGDIVKTRPAKRDIQIIDLLTHTSGIGYPFIDSQVSEAYRRADIIDGVTARNITLEDVVLRLARQPLLFDPGSDYAYGLSTDVLGRLIEKISGDTLEAFFYKEIFEPLDMTDTHFYLPESLENRLVTLYADPDGTGIVEATGNEDNFAPENPNYPVEGARTYFSGGAGLSSTAMDYAVFLQMLLNDGEYNGRRVLSAKSVELMRTSRIDLDENGENDFALGFRVVETGDKQNWATPGTYSWGGAFKTSYWVDPTRKIVVVFMAQVRPTKTTIHNRVGTLTYKALE